MGEIAAGGATIACALFAGAALYITLVEHPARLAGGAAPGVQHFRESYPRAARMQAPLAVAGGALGLAAWLAGESIAWLGAGSLLALAAPYTVIVVAPTNHRLQDPALRPESEESDRLLRASGRLHLPRTAGSLAALVVMLVLLAR